MITILLNTSTFSYWTKTCHASKNIKKYLHDVVVRGRQNLFLFRLGRNFFLLEQKDSKWIDYHSFKDKHIFLLDKNVSRVKELNNTLTMLSSEDDKVCSSSVWEETSFCWNRKTVNELIIILLKTSTFSYWTRTCHVSKSLTIPLRCCRQRTTELVPLPFGRRPLSGWTKRQ